MTDGKFSGEPANIRAVIFDYGDVLCQRAPRDEFVPLAKILNITPERFLECYMQNRLAYDRGDLTLGDYWRGFAKETGAPVNDALIEELDHRDRGLWWRLNPQLMEWAGRLRASGIKTGILSNMFIGLAKQIRQEAPWFDRFDGYTFSAELRVTKPDAAIYRHSLEQLGVRPKQALLLDDRQVNIDGARAVGMEGLLYHDAARLREDLHAWGFSILPEKA